MDMNAFRFLLRSIAMAVFRWGSAFDAFRDLEREMDHLLHSVNMAFEGLRIGRPFPAVNIYELEGEYLPMACSPSGAAALRCPK
jgi:HSP20 family protein